MAAVKAGGDRQALHEAIRRHSMAAAEEVSAGRENDLIDRLENDGTFKTVKGRLRRMMKAEQYIGRSPEQVREFLRDEVEPRLKPRKRLVGWKAAVKV